MQEILASRERIYGKDHPLVADATTPMLGVYLELGRPEEASTLAARARKIYESSIGLDHHNAMHNQGVSLSILSQ